MGCEHIPKLSVVESEALKWVFDAIEGIEKECGNNYPDSRRLAKCAKTAFDKICDCVDESHKKIHARDIVLAEQEKELSVLRNRCDSLQAIIDAIEAGEKFDG